MNLVINDPGDQISPIDRDFGILLLEAYGGVYSFNPIPSDPYITFNHLSPVDDPGFFKHNILHAHKDTGF